MEEIYCKYYSTVPLLINREQFIFYLMILLPTVDYFWRAYLFSRQRRVCETTLNKPEEIQDAMSQEMFDNIREYNIKMINYWVFTNGYDLLITISSIYFGLHSRIWYFVEMNSSWQNENLIEFIWLCAFVNFCILSYLPISLYEYYCLGEYDLFIDNLSSKLLYVPIVFIASLIIKVGGDYFFFYYWIFSSLTFFVLEPVRKVHLASLFNRVLYLQDIPLYRLIDELCAEVKFPLANIHVCEGLKPSVHLCYVAQGKNIFLYDALFDEYFPFEREEVVALVAHQLAHWKLGHHTYKLIVGELWLFIALTFYSIVFHSPLIYRAVGFHSNAVIVPVGLILMSHIVPPFQLVLSYCRNLCYRNMEYEADRFVKSLHKEEHFKSALMKLHHGKYQFPVTDPLFCAWFSHRPTFLDRLEKLRQS